MRGATGGLGGRVRRLEQALAGEPVARSCTSCGLEHARRVTVAELRALVRVIGGTPVPDPPAGTVRPGPFCRCGCCAEHRGLADLTHERADGGVGR